MSEAPPMMFNYPREDGEEEIKMDTDDGGIEIDHSHVHMRRHAARAF